MTISEIVPAKALQTELNNFVGTSIQKSVNMRDHFLALVEKIITAKRITGTPEELGKIVATFKDDAEGLSLTDHPRVEKARDRLKELLVKSCKGNVFLPVASVGHGHASMPLPRRRYRDLCGND